VFLWTGKLEEAEKAFRETLEIREKLAADYPDEQGYQHAYPGATWGCAYANRAV
jgi:hypothetical protein